MIDDKKIANLSHLDRHSLWKNCHDIATLEAKRIIGLIEKSGLPYLDPKGLAEDGLLGKKILKIINSVEGIEKMVKATVLEQPALVPIDRICQELFGSEYKNQHDAPANVGYWVARKMRKLGYFDSSSRETPPDCLVRTGIVFSKTNPEK